MEECDGDCCGIENEKQTDRNITNGGPGKITRFGPVNSGSRRATFHHEGRFLARGSDIYTRLRLGERVLEPEICDISLAVPFEVPSQGVLPSATEVTPTRETYHSFADGFDMSFTFPPPSKSGITCAAAPLPTDGILHRNSSTAAWLGNRPWLR